MTFMVELVDRQDSEALHRCWTSRTIWLLNHQYLRMISVEYSGKLWCAVTWILPTGHVGAVGVVWKKIVRSRGRLLTNAMRTCNADEQNRMMETHLSYPYYAALSILGNLHDDQVLSISIYQGLSSFNTVFVPFSRLSMMSSFFKRCQEFSLKRQPSKGYCFSMSTWTGDGGIKTHIDSVIGSLQVWNRQNISRSSTCITAVLLISLPLIRPALEAS